MDFLAVIEQARAALQRKGRMTYRTLKRQFALDDEALEDLKEELIKADRVARDENGEVLVWTGGETPEETIAQPTAAPVSELPSPVPAQSERATAAGERRQLTVMFCDLVGSTALSEQLDPEELQSVIQTYQEVSAQVIERYEGYIAQYLGDGLLVYFGYPAAHEDDAARAIRAGLELVTALGQARSQFSQPVQVRIGIHTGLVVIGDMGGGSRHEQLALGETPNIAARIQGQAEPDEVVISAATYHLVEGLFACEDRGQPELKGVSKRLTLHRVIKEGEGQSRFQVVAHKGLTHLVGRDYEGSLLHERWEQAKEGAGQVVLLSGEPGIGKSRLVEVLKETVRQEGARYRELRCSPYHQNSALSPIIDYFRNLLQLSSDDSPERSVTKLQQALQHYHFPQADTLALLTALLSLPRPQDIAQSTYSLQKQKELTYAAIVAWLCEDAQQQAVAYTWEDLHWADPSTLEVLSLFLDQVPTSGLFVTLTFRPEFTPPWVAHSYMSHLTLSRLSQSQVEQMVERVTNGKTLPATVVEQIAAKTDGVPLFVEELTKTIIESGLVQAVNNHYELDGSLSTLHVPTTLQDSLMARLDRLGIAKDVAQRGAVIGREFSYRLLQAIATLDEETLQDGLSQLVDAELVYQRGVPPEAQYQFKHALVRDTAYQSLLKRTRQQYHQQIGHVLEAQFAETVETQPEIVAYHYTEASLAPQAIVYWQRAGQRAVTRSAYTEAVVHLSQGLALLKTLPDTPERVQQELSLHVSLGTSLMMTKGQAAPEVGHTYARARELCQQLGDTSQLFRVLGGLSTFHFGRGELQTACELGAQLLALAQRQPDPAIFLRAHMALGQALFYRGELTAAREQCEQLMSGHIRSGASSPESKLVRDLSYDTPRLMDYSPQELYRRSAAVDTWASTEGHQHLCRGHPGETDREPSRVGAGPGESRGGRQTPVPVAA